MFHLQSNNSEKSIVQARNVCARARDAKLCRNIMNAPTSIGVLDAWGEWKCADQLHTNPFILCFDRRQYAQLFLNWIILLYKLWLTFLYSTNTGVSMGAITAASSTVATHTHTWIKSFRSISLNRFEIHYFKGFHWVLITFAANAHFYMFIHMKRKATRATNFMQLSTLISIPQRSHSNIQQDFAQLDSYFFSALLLILFACLFGFNENAYHICTVHIIRAITRWYNKFKSFHLNFYIRVHTKICVFFCSLEFWSHIKFKAMQTAHRKFVYMSRIFFLDLKCRWFSLIKKKRKRCHCEAAAECIASVNDVTFQWN